MEEAISRRAARRDLAIEKRQRTASLSKAGIPKPIETMAEAAARNRAARAASALLASVASSIPAQNPRFDLGEVTNGRSATPPLGNAAPFEYVKSAASQVSETIAGVFLTPAEEAECMFQYNLDMAECSAYYSMQKSSWGMCSDRASQRLARCVTGKGIL
ncbi:hypothetical protein ABH944_003163 [Caballeronia udeis]|jgi:hypothetical protein|uniref:Uncharacterized protein n=1 Tax=Caballeronia udeis TaxID=1232866 RepID=A0ABW8MI76_9BURK